LPEGFASPDALEFVLSLRAYQASDFKRLLEIDEACFVQGIAYSAEELRYFLDMPSAITLVAFEEESDKSKIAGFIIADRFRQRRATRLMGRIITIDVAPGKQHLGVGTLLLTAAETGLKEAGCDYVTLETAVDNEPALRFYKKQGYSVLRVLPRYYLNSIDGLLMGKKL
jgi:[ribosomal protein S18]-alanine N-acetyltransferase